MLLQQQRSNTKKQQAVKFRRAPSCGLWSTQKLCRFIFELNISASEFSSCVHVCKPEKYTLVKLRVFLKGAFAKTYQRNLNVLSYREVSKLLLWKSSDFDFSSNFINWNGSKNISQTICILQMTQTHTNSLNICCNCQIISLLQDNYRYRAPLLKSRFNVTAKPKGTITNEHEAREWLTER